MESDKVRAFVEQVLLDRDEEVRRVTGKYDALLSGVRELYPDLVAAAEKSPRGQTTREPKAQVASTRKEAQPRRLPLRMAAVQAVHDLNKQASVSEICALLGDRGQMPSDAKYPDAMVRRALREAAAEGLVLQGRPDGRSTSYGPLNAESATADTVTLPVAGSHLQEGGTPSEPTHHDHRPLQGWNDGDSGTAAPLMVASNY